MASSNDSGGGPLGFILDAVKELAKQRLLLVMVGLTTGTTVGTKLGAPDRFTGRDGRELRAELTQDMDKRAARMGWQIQLLENELKDLKEWRRYHTREAEGWKIKIQSNENCCNDRRSLR